MKHQTILLCLPFLLVAPLAAQAATATDYGQGSTQTPVSGPGLIPLPSYSSTYSYTHTRGFWFKVPCPMIVTSWQVPDEQSHGTMHVAFYRMTAAPPAFSATRNETPVYYQLNAPAAAKVLITPPLIYKPGDYFGVLGACGPDTKGYLLNSYGQGGFSSNLGCGTVTLQRMLMQSAISTSKGVGGVSSGGTGSIGRVKVEIIKTTVPSLTTTALPRLGTRAVMDMVPGFSNAAGGVVALGRGRTNLALPLCTILANFPYLFIFPVSGGAGKVNLPIPNDPVLAGAGPINCQGFVIAPGNFGGTNGVEWFLGT